MLCAEDLTCVLAGALVGLLEPVRKSWTLCLGMLCALASREELDYYGVDGRRACLFGPVRTSWTIVWCEDLLCND